jgi:hypothetical protein
MNASEHPAVQLLGYSEVTGRDADSCACGCTMELHIAGTYVSASTGWTLQGYKCQHCMCLLNMGLEVETPGGDCAFGDTKYDFLTESEAGPDAFHHSPE